MHILTGSHRFRARETSGGYKHPHQVQGLVPPRFMPGESPSSAAAVRPATMRLSQITHKRTTCLSGTQCHMRGAHQLTMLTL